MRGNTVFQWACTILVLALAAPNATAEPAVCATRKIAFLLALPGFQSPAELLLPLKKPSAVAVLLHGSDVEDLDGSITADNKVISRPLRTIAYGLACKGIATVRYNKRFVTGPSTVDRDAFSKMKLQDFASDAEAAIVATKAMSEVDKAPLFLVGWSEGTTVASDVAVKRRDLAGIVLIAPVATSFATSLQRDWPSTARPYVERYAKNGVIGPEGLASAAAGPGGLISQMYVGFLKGFAPGSRINPDIDSNKDFQISLTDEADPTFKAWFADRPDGGLGIYASASALPGVAAQIDKISAPILMLQGANDGNVDPQASRRLARDNPQRVNFRLYPGLGHSLGPAVSPQEDRFRDPTPEPINDMAGWMLRRSR